MTTQNETRSPVLAALPDQPQLPDALLPVILELAEGLLAHSDADGRLFWCEGQKWNERNWYAMPALAVACTDESPANHLRGDGRLIDLITRAGRMLVAEFNDPAEVNMAESGKFWYDGNRPHEWITEAWLNTWDLLGGPQSDPAVTAGWADVFRRVGETYCTYMHQAAGLRRMTSPNLKISTNHFIFFAAILTRIGQLLGEEDWVSAGLAAARKVADHMHPDGYWPETHGPTTSYNFVTLDALGILYHWTGVEWIEPVLRRACEFHQRWVWPNAVKCETIDQRVRNRGQRPVQVMAPMSYWPDGRGLAEWTFAAEQAEGIDTADGGTIGGLVTSYLHYRRGDVAPPVCTGDYTAELSDLPAGFVRRRPWAVALSGIPSTKRQHRYTLDRQNLLSLWHDRAGLILGGGNSRTQPQLATFHARIPVDRTAVDPGQSPDADIHVPVAADCELSADTGGGRLDLEYWGFDAELTVAPLGDAACRIVASAGCLPVNDPVTFNPNVMIRPDGPPVVTDAGESLPVGNDTPEWTRTGAELGGGFGQGAWHIAVPDDAVLRYPVQPYGPNPAWFYNTIGLLTIPATNRRVEITVRVREPNG